MHNFNRSTLKLDLWNRFCKLLRTMINMLVIHTQQHITACPNPSTAPSSIDTTACINYTSTQSITQLHTHTYTHIYKHKYTKHVHNHLGEVGATKAGSNRGSNECYHCCTEIAIGTFMLYTNTSSITYTPHYQHLTLPTPYITIRDCWPLSYKYKHLSMRTVIWTDSTTFKRTDITTIKRNRHYNNRR